MEAQLPLEENPFRKREGDCPKCKAKGVRLFWCWVCHGIFCWDDFKEHQC